MATKYKYLEKIGQNSWMVENEDGVVGTLNENSRVFTPNTSPTYDTEVQQARMTKLKEWGDTTREDFLNTEALNYLGPMITGEDGVNVPKYNFPPEAPSESLNTNFRHYETPDNTRVDTSNATSRGPSPLSDASETDITSQYNESISRTIDSILTNEFFQNLSSDVNQAIDVAKDATAMTINAAINIPRTIAGEDAIDWTNLPRWKESLSESVKTNAQNINNYLNDITQMEEIKKNKDY